MTTIYHNPRCRKSRETLALLDKNNEQIEIVLYMENPPTETELSGILEKLKLFPIELVRKNESVWKENFKGKQLSDAEIIEAMVKNPKLIERPVVIKNGKAALGRPPESVLNIL